VYSHQAFAKELGGLPFDLIGDFERKMVADYGVRRDDVEGYSGVARRTIFIIDQEGVIRWTWVTSKEQRLPDYDVVMEEAKKIAAGK
jgi:peroxiredoxin